MENTQTAHILDRYFTNLQGELLSALIKDFPNIKINNEKWCTDRFITNSLSIYLEGDVSKTSIDPMLIIQFRGDYAVVDLDVTMSDGKIIKDILSSYKISIGRNIGYYQDEVVLICDKYYDLLLQTLVDLIHEQGAN